MSEKPKFTPNQMNQYAISRAESDIGLISNEEATHNQLGHFVVNLTQETIEKEMGIFSVSTPNVKTQEQVPATLNQEAGSLSPERIKEIASNAFYNTRFRVNGVAGQRIAFHAPNGLHRNNINAKNQVESRFVHSEMRGWSKAFSDEGIAEVVTIAKVEDMSDPMLDLRAFKDEKLKGEPVYAVQYATITQGDSKYDFRDAINRPDSWNSFVALLPESMAKEIEASLKANPAQVRDIFNFLSENPDADYGDDQTLYRIAQNGIAQPPFNEWRQQDGGISRMAFRTASNQEPGQSEVIEF